MGSGRPSTVTRTEIMELIDQHIRDKLIIKTDKTAFEMSMERRDATVSRRNRNRWNQKSIDKWEN
jgi:hypothetical protein